MTELHLANFELYNLAREYSRLAWSVFKGLNRDVQWKTGWQFLESADSVQANIAEAYGRFHYKDKRNFEYHARGSLLESMSWAQILNEREFVNQEVFQDFINLGKKISVKLNNHLSYLTTQANLTNP